MSAWPTIPLPPVTSTRAVFSMSIRGFSNGDPEGQRCPPDKAQLTPDMAEAPRWWCLNRDRKGVAARARAEPAVSRSFVVLFLRPGHVVRMSRTPIVRGGVVAPDLRPLRPVLMPWPRLEIAELLVVHLVEIGEELDRDAVGILMIDRDVVPDQVTDRAPEQLDVLASEKIAGTVDLGLVAQLEREVVNVGVVGLQQVDGVVIAAAT